MNSLQIGSWILSLAVLATAGGGDFENALSEARPSSPASPTANEKAGGTASSAEEPVPAAEELLPRMIEALGGEAALARLESVHQTGTVKVAGFNLEGTMEIRWQAPNLLWVETDFPGAGRTTQGHDGSVAWRVAPGQAPVRLQGREARQMTALGDFRGPLTYRERFKSVTVEGNRIFEGRKCWVLALQGEEGFLVHLFVDAETNLPAGQEQPLAQSDGPALLTSVYWEFGEAAGVRLLTRWTVRFGEQEQHFDLTRILIEDHPPGTFDAPESLRTPPASTSEGGA